MDRERLFKYLEDRYASKRDMISRIPLGIQPEELWRELTERRVSRGVALPLNGHVNTPYWYVVTDRMVTASEKIVETMYSESQETDPYAGPVPVSALEEVFFTGYVEGMQMTLREAMEFLAGDKLPRDIEEQLVYNNRMATAFVGNNLFRPIDAPFLSELAGILTEGMDEGGRDYRDTASAEFSPSPGEQFTYPPPETISGCMDEFIRFLSDMETHPLIKAGVAQIWMMIVRPFREGNDRLGRLLSYMILLRAGYTFFADVSLSALIARKSYAYYEAVANSMRGENEGDLTYFLDHFLELLSRAIDERKLIMARKTEQAIMAEREKARQPLEPAAGPLSGNHGIRGEEPELPDFSGFERVPMKENKPKNGSTEFVEDPIDILRGLTEKPGNVLPKFAAYVLEKIGRSEKTFTTMEVENAIGVNRKCLSRSIVVLKTYGIITPGIDSSGTAIYRILVDAEGPRNPDGGEPDSFFRTPADLLNELSVSASPKDRRIATMITACKEKGELNLSDYEERGEGLKWYEDMAFALQLGLVEKLDPQRYRILEELGAGRQFLSRHQKKLVRELYEYFGQESFSREMLTATLDYTGPHVAAYLHRFTLLMILDCRKGDVLYYQLIVNPEDHPECFDLAA